MEIIVISKLYIKKLDKDNYFNYDNNDNFLKNSCYKCNNNQTLLNYYWSPFIHSLNKGDENYIPNKLVENIIDNN